MIHVLCGTHEIYRSLCRKLGLKQDEVRRITRPPIGSIISKEDRVIFSCGHGEVEWEYLVYAALETYGMEVEYISCCKDGQPPEMYL